MEKLVQVLRKEGIDVMTTREPGGTPIGERIRAVVLDSRTHGLAPLAEVALMFGSRAQQIQENILPALERGTWVVCDRFTDSSEAYQGGGRQLGSEAILSLHRVLCGNLQPDLTILMDSDVSASVNRARRRNQQKCDGKGDENRFEKESRAFFTRVRDKYLEIAEREPKRVALIDARSPMEVTHTKIMRAVRERLLEPVVD